MQISRQTIENKELKIEKKLGLYTYSTKMEWHAESHLNIHVSWLRSVTRRDACALATVSVARIVSPDNIM